MAKGKRVLFVLILKILDGDRAQSRSFWKVLKKHQHCHPIKPKKPKVSLGAAPEALKKPKVSLTATHMAEAILKKPDLAKDEEMTGVKPSFPTDPPPSAPLPLSFRSLRCLASPRGFLSSHFPFLMQV